MYYAITKGELWAIRRALDTGEDVADAIAICEGVANGSEINPEPVTIDDEDREITEFAIAEGC